MITCDGCRVVCSDSNIEGIKSVYCSVQWGRSNMFGDPVPNTDRASFKFHLCEICRGGVKTLDELNLSIKEGILNKLGCN
tara:strand:+ start:1753 stop:1992 length:240 start_codon:yes stop_codon:yes gene_type:complete